MTSIHRLTLALAVSAFSPLFAFGDLIVDFQFSDAAGNGLANTTNAGSDPATWNFNVNGQPGEAATNGSGLFIVGADATAGSAGISSDYTRLLDFADVSTGTFRFEYRLDNWDMDDTPALNGAADQEGFTLRVRDSVGNNVSLISAIAGNDTNFRIRHSTSGLAGTAAQTNFALNDTDGMVIWAEGNLSTGTFTSGYNNGSDVTLISDGGGLTNIADIQLAIEGTNAWSSADSISIDYLTLDVTAVPEPRAALLFGSSLLGLIVRRRR